AFEGFDVETVAGYGEKDRARLLSDASIIRNRLKVDAAIHNAGCILDMRDSHGGFADWLAAHHPLTKDEWVKLFKKTFKFTGGEITGEFLMSTGYLSGAHREACPVFGRIAKTGPAWMRET
ncbi:MAG: DNA-3-methyladenine glycosylase I, partial [Alphaproteobacteria bacterium]|nr:DNA-3-methyladenine glycosylase I [Alphaproteobacteria bacterium]